MQVIGSQFTGGGKPGAFGWMLKQPEYADALFVFNDNEEEFRQHQRHEPGSGRCKPGGGNAGIRKYQCQDPPRSAGIPTGSNGSGYPHLDDHVRGVLDEALRNIRELVDSGRFQRVFYSASGEDPDDLGSGIFKVGLDVRRYIVAGLRALQTTA